MKWEPARFCTASGPSIEKGGDLAAILSTLQPGDVLFIDEIHRLPKAVEEILYPAMGGLRHPYRRRQGINGAYNSIESAAFYLSRCDDACRRSDSPFARPLWDPYPSCNFMIWKDLSQIVRRTSRVMGNAIDEQAVLEIARRSRGTPRIAKSAVPPRP